MMATMARLHDELIDREAIRNCLYRYSRGVDRCDENMLRSAYWPDANDHHLDFNGNIDEFIAWSMPKLKTMDQTMHMIGNIMIELSGSEARVESYYYGYHRINHDGRKIDTVGAGRYLDKFECRGGEWRIADRVVMTDWFRDYPDSADWGAGPFGMKGAPMGARQPDDLSYTWLGLR